MIHSSVVKFIGKKYNKFLYDVPRIESRNFLSIINKITQEMNYKLFKTGLMNNIRSMEYA